MLTHPARRRSHRRTIFQEFRDSFRAGPRAWCLTAFAAFVLGCLTFPSFNKFALACGLVFLLPALFLPALGRLAVTAWDLRGRRRLQRTPPGLRRLHRARAGRQREGVR